MSIADTVKTWFAERLATGEIARHTPAYNQAREALDDLIARLDPPAAPAKAAKAPDPAPAPEPAPQPEAQPET